MNKIEIAGNKYRTTLINVRIIIYYILSPILSFALCYFLFPPVNVGFIIGAYITLTIFFLYDILYKIPKIVERYKQELSYRAEFL